MPNHPRSAAFADVLFAVGLIWSGAFLALLALCEMGGSSAPRLALVAIGALEALVLGALVYARPSRWRAGLVAALLVGMGILFFGPGLSRETFARRLAAVRAGMSLAEVREVMRGYPENVGAAGHVFYRHSRHAMYDADVAIVTLDGGVVAQVEFLQD